MLPARILKFVHEDVLIATLEPEAALRELVHAAQKVDRTLQHIRKIQQRSIVQSGPVLRERHAEHPPDTSREDAIQISRKAAHDVLYRAAQ